MEKNIINSIIFIIILLLFSNIVSALSIYPSYHPFEYLPGDVQSKTITILNNDKLDMKILVEKKGDLKDFIHYEADIIEIKADQKEFKFDYDVIIDKDLDPGVHEGKIVFKTLLDGDGLFSYSISLNSILKLRVPNFGSFAQYKISENHNPKQYIFLIDIDNFGSEDIKKGTLYFDVYSIDGKKRYSQIISNISILSNLHTTKTIIWEDGFDGEYTIKTKFLFNEKEIKDSQDFILNIGKIEDLELNNTKFENNKNIVFLFLVFCLIILTFFQFINHYKIRKDKLINLSFHKKFNFKKGKK